MPGIPPFRKGEKLVLPDPPKGPSVVPPPPPQVIHVHHHDIERHAESFNEGYEAAMAQHLADDPSLADDWLNAKLAEAWQQGYASGHSRAMRRMSDEPNVADSSNPYR